MHCRALLIISLVALALPAALTTPATACTSFMLETDDGIYFAHSLNQGSMPRVDGGMHINPRDTWKRGYDFPTLMGQKTDAEPTIIWKSLYGSATNSPLGRENPDGGMNEAGLFIWEMGYDAEYSTDPTLPVLFQMQWMQYQLDNYATVEEVLANADRIALDGWGWHYFVADATGDAAIIDHVNGKAVIYTGDDLPIPLCCNSRYPLAMEFLSQHKGFGGDIPLVQNFEEIPRFMYGAKLLTEHANEEPVQYCFDMLDAMSVNVRWSTVFDLKNMTVYFSTNVDKNIRSFSFSPEDFDPACGTVTLDMNAAGSGDVRSTLQPFDPAADVELLDFILNMFMEDADPSDVRAAAEAHVDRLTYVDLSESYAIDGAWSGTVTVSVKGEDMSLPVALNLGNIDGVYSGVVEGEAFGGVLPLHSIEFNGGLLSFTSRNPDSGELIRYHLYLTGRELKGSAYTWDWGNRKTAVVALTRS